MSMSWMPWLVFAEKVESAAVKPPLKEAMVTPALTFEL